MTFPLRRDLVISQRADFVETFTWLTGLPDNPRWRDPWTPSMTFVPRDITQFDTTFYVALVRNRAAQPDESPDAWEPISPTDLTGWSARMMAREHKGDVDPALSLTDTLAGDGSGFVLGGAEGTIRMHVAHETTAELPDAVLGYEIEIVSDDDEVVPFMAGQITVRQSMIR